MLKTSASTPIGVDNMIMLDNLTEDTVLNNLEIRYKQLQVYTYIGNILVAVNPYRELTIYGSDALAKYSTETNKAVLPPHIFAIADNAYVRMVEEERNQSILISGESGSGKSESTKLILRYLASRNSRHSKIEQMLVEVSPILESFGNAKTSQNDNSSRFGKFIEVYFGTEKQGLVGAKIVTYLLEKSRIVQQGENERNYHVFYQLIQGASEAERKMYKLQLPQEFTYLNQGNCYTIAGVSDAEDFSNLKSGFRFLGFDDQMQANIFSILAAILHLGNIKFAKERDEIKIVNIDELQFVASMLRLQPEQLHKALCSRKMSVKGSAAVVIPLQVQEANNFRESLAKTLYSQLFTWIVKTINTKIDPPTVESSIGILDIFGFESFQKNSFEQLCINFANEKLAQYFNSYIFKQEQEEYKAQKIDWKNIDFVDNEECVNLIEKKPLGILGILDEECRFPQATDSTFLDKLVKNLSKHPNFEVPKMSKNLFVVNHYAGKVPYTVDGMLEKNKDLLSDDLIEICSHPSAGFTREIMSAVTQQEVPVNPRELTGTLRKAGATFNTVGAQFKQQLNELVRALAATTPSFVRCVKPNPTKTPGGFDKSMVLTQLKYSGMLETVRIRKAGFGARMSFIDFYDRYKCLCAKMIGKEKVSDEIMCDYLSKALSKMKILVDNGWQKGRTKIFLRDAQQAKLEEVRVRIYIQKCIIIQKYWKMHSTQRYYKLLKVSTIKIQACFRGYRARKRNPLAWKRTQVTKMQTLIRRALCRRRYLGIITIVRKKAEEEAARKKKEDQARDEAGRISEAPKVKSAPSSATSPQTITRPEQSTTRPLGSASSAQNLNKPPNYQPPSISAPVHPAPMTAPAAQSQFKQIRKETSQQALPLDGLSAQSTPALRALARDASPQSPQDPPSAGLLATMHRRKETVVPDAMKTMPNLSAAAKQKMFTPTSSESVLPLPSSGTLRRLGDATGITHKVATLHRTNTSNMPTAPIYVRSNSMTGLASSFNEVQPVQRPSKNTELPAILKPEDAPHYTWAQFFVSFCNKETGDFTTKIQSHLLKTSSGYTKSCLQIFDYITELMGDQLSKKSKTNNAMQPFLVTQNLLDIGIKCPDLIDEIFAMICKQLTNNPNSSSTEKGWELLAVCCCTFSPSASVIRYILAKILSHKGDRTNFWPDFCAKNILRNHTAAPRKFVPSIQEISALKNCSKVKTNIAFMAGKHFPVEMESHTTCGDVCGVIEGAFNIKHTTQYTLFEVFGELERAISSDERMCDIVAKWELYQTSISSKGLNANFAFYYKRHLFPQPTLEIHDEVEALFTYHQAIFSVLHDHYPLTEDLVLTLAALQICNDPKIEIRKCIPKNWFKNHALAEWDKMINTKSNFLGLRGFNPAMARQVYLQYMTQVPLFGSTFFSVKETEPPRASVVIAINIFGVHVCEPSTKEWLRSYSLTQIERWGNTESTFFFRLETDPPMSFSYDTIQGAEICATLARHSVGLMDATYARGIVDFVGAIQFQIGDLIKITGKDISPGWYSGTTSSKTGLFPIASVQLGFADPPPLESTGNFNPQKKIAKEATVKSSSHNSYAPKVMKEVDAQKFPFTNFAAANFRTQSSKRSKNFDAGTRVSYSKYPLEESLLRLSAEHNSIAIAVFDKILKFISETHFTKSVVRVAQDIVQTGIDKADMRDEIYCQLIKQATLNPNTVSFGKVWELLAFCSCCFMPSETLVDYILAYFQVNTGWQSDARHLAVDCLRKLQFTLQYGDRVAAPSVWEMQFIMRNQPMVCGVLLPDRTTLEIPIESSTNSEDLLSRVAEKMKIPLDEFQEFYLYTYVPEKKSGFKATTAAWRSVKPARKVADLWSAAEKLQLLGGEQPAPSLKIRRKFVIGPWPSTVISSNPFYCQLEFGQAFEEFVEGKIACTQGEAVVFTVLALQILHGDYDARRKIVSTKTIYDYMPKYILDDGGNVVTWVDKINLAHQQLAGKHLSETRIKFLSRMRAWKVYGSSIFKVEQRKKPYVLWMAINQRGVDFLDYPKLQPLTQYSFSQILSWNFSKEGEFNLLTGSLQNPTKEYFTANECQEIAEILDTYLHMHQKAEEQTKYKSKNMDKSTFAPTRTFKTPASQRGSRNSRLSIPKPRNSAQINAGKRISKILTDPSDDAAPARPIPASPHASTAPRGVASPHGSGAFAKPSARVANPRSSAASMRFNFKK